MKPESEIVDMDSKLDISTSGLKGNKNPNTTTLLSLMLGNFAIGTGTLIFPGILLPLSEGLGVSLSKAALLVTFYALSYAIFSPLIAGFTQSVDKRNMLVIGCSVLGIGYLISALASSYFIVVLGQVVASIGASIFTPTSSTMAVAISPSEKRTTAIGIVFAGFSLGSALGLPIASYVGDRYGWQHSLWFICYASLISLVLLVLFVPKGIRGHTIKTKDILGIFKRAPISIGLMITALQMAVQLICFTFISLILCHFGFISQNDVPLFLGIFGCAALAGTFLGASLADRFTPEKVIQWSFVVLGLSLYAFNFAMGNTGLVILFLVIWGISGFAFQPAQQSYLVKKDRTNAGLVLALNASAIYIGTAMGSSIGGVIINQLDVNSLVIISSILALLLFPFFKFANGLEDKTVEGQ